MIRSLLQLGANMNINHEPKFSTILLSALKRCKHHWKENYCVDGKTNEEIELLGKYYSYVAFFIFLPISPFNGHSLFYVLPAIIFFAKLFIRD